MKSESVSQSLSCVQLFVSPWTIAIRFLCPWNSPGKNIGVGCHFLLQGIFLIQGLNSGLPHCRQTLYQLSHIHNNDKMAWITLIISFMLF